MRDRTTILHDANCCLDADNPEGVLPFLLEALLDIRDLLSHQTGQAASRRSPYEPRKTPA